MVRTLRRELLFALEDLSQDVTFSCKTRTLVKEMSCRVKGDVQKDFYLKEPNLKDRPRAVPRGDHKTFLITVSPWWKRFAVKLNAERCCRLHTSGCDGLSPCFSSSQTPTGTARQASSEWGTGVHPSLDRENVVSFCSHLYKDQNTNFLFLEDLTRRTVEVQDTFRKCLSRQWFYTSDINACFMSELFFRLDVNAVGSVCSLCSLRSSTASALKLRKNTSSSKESFIAQPLSLGCSLRCWRRKLALNWFR